MRCQEQQWKVNGRGFGDSWLLPVWRYHLAFILSRNTQEEHKALQSGYSVTQLIIRLSNSRKQTLKINKSLILHIHLMISSLWIGSFSRSLLFVPSPSSAGVFNLLLLTSTVAVLLFASKHRHKMSTRTSTVYKYVKEHYPMSKEHPGAREHIYKK
jgi:hypothetical protein